MFQPFGRQAIPYLVPQMSRLALYDFLRGLATVAYWPLDDVTNTPFHRAINGYTAIGRELVLNGAPSSATNWSLGTNITYSSGAFHFAAAPVGQGATQTIVPIVAGHAYSITYTISNYSAGLLQIIVGGSSLPKTPRNANGTYTEVQIASSSTFSLQAVTSAFTGDVSNISVKEVYIQGSSTALGTNPDGGWLDGDGSGSVGAYTPVNSATVSHQTVTQHGGASGTVIRIARNGVNTPGASQPLTPGKIYQFQAWCRNGGGAGNPRITHGGNVLWQGIASTTWQFVKIYVETIATTLVIGSSASAGTAYTEWDDIVLTEIQYVIGDEIVLDGDMALTGIANYFPNRAGVVTKETVTDHNGASNQVLRVAYGGTANPAANLSSATAAAKVVLQGHKYWIRGWARGDGTASPLIQLGEIQNVFTGTSSTTWQQINVAVQITSFVAGAADVNLLAVVAVAGYVEFDDLSIVEIPSMSLTPTNGVIPGIAETNRLLTSVSFDGVNDFINANSGYLNSVLPMGSKTFNIFAKINLAALTDGSSHYIARIQIDTSNTINIQKTTTNNTFSISIVTSGGTMTKTFTITTVGWHLFSVVYDSVAGTTKAYLDGVQQGTTISGMTDWAGNLTASTVCFGASTTTPANRWSGFESHAWLQAIAEVPENLLEAVKLGDVA